MKKQTIVTIAINCSDKFSIINGTIFENTRYPLVDWFKVITLMLNTKTGISAMDIMRNMDCLYVGEKSRKKGQQEILAFLFSMVL